MSVIAAAVRELMAAGVAGDDLIAAIERIEAAAPSLERTRSVGAERQRRYRERHKPSQNVTNRHESSRNVTESPPVPDKESPPAPPKKLTITPPSSDPKGSSSPTLFVTETDFDQFWKAYPHKVGKADAKRKFDAARKETGVTLPEMLAGIARYRLEKPPDQAWCNPATWLFQGRWTDERAEQINGNGSGDYGAGPLLAFGSGRSGSGRPIDTDWASIAARRRGYT